MRSQDLIIPEREHADPGFISDFLKELIEGDAIARRYFEVPFYEWVQIERAAVEVLVEYDVYDRIKNPPDYDPRDWLDNPDDEQLAPEEVDRVNWQNWEPILVVRSRYQHLGQWSIYLLGSGDIETDFPEGFTLNDAIDACYAEPESILY